MTGKVLVRRPMGGTGEFRLRTPHLPYFPLTAVQSGQTPVG